MTNRRGPIDPYVVLRLWRTGEVCWEAVCSWDCARDHAKATRVGIGRFESASGWDFAQPHVCLACGRVIPAVEEPDFPTADMLDDADGYHEVEPQPFSPLTFSMRFP